MRWALSFTHSFSLLDVTQRIRCITTSSFVFFFLMLRFIKTLFNFPFVSLFFTLISILSYLCGYKKKEERNINVCDEFSAQNTKASEFQIMILFIVTCAILFGSIENCHFHRHHIFFLLCLVQLGCFSFLIYHKRISKLIRLIISKFPSIFVSSPKQKKKNPNSETMSGNRSELFYCFKSDRSI